MQGCQRKKILRQLSILKITIFQEVARAQQHGRIKHGGVHFNSSNLRHQWGSDEPLTSLVLPLFGWCLQGWFQILIHKKRGKHSAVVLWIVVMLLLVISVFDKFRPHALTNRLHHTGLSCVGFHRNNILETMQRDDTLPCVPHLKDVLDFGAQFLWQGRTKKRIKLHIYYAIKDYFNMIY